MAGDLPRSYRVSPAAQRDLDAIWDDTARQWSLDQADRYLKGIGQLFELLCDTPLIGRERTEIDPPVRLHPYRAHIVAYRNEPESLVVLRVFHGRQHWQALLADDE